MLEVEQRFGRYWIGGQGTEDSATDKTSGVGPVIPQAEFDQLMRNCGIEPSTCQQASSTGVLSVTSSVRGHLLPMYMMDCVVDECGKSPVTPAEREVFFKKFRDSAEIVKRFGFNVGGGHVIPYSQCARPRKGANFYGYPMNRWETEGEQQRRLERGTGLQEEGVRKKIQQGAPESGVRKKMQQGAPESGGGEDARLEAEILCLQSRLLQWPPHSEVARLESEIRGKLEQYWAQVRASRQTETTLLERCPLVVQPGKRQIDQTRLLAETVSRTAESIAGSPDAKDSTVARGVFGVHVRNGGCGTILLQTSAAKDLYGTVEGRKMTLVLRQQDPVERRTEMQAAFIRLGETTLSETEVLLQGNTEVFGTGSMDELAVTQYRWLAFKTLVAMSLEREQVPTVPVRALIGMALSLRTSIRVLDKQLIPVWSEHVSLHEREVLWILEGELGIH
jgi:hypothetical protein